MLHYYDQVQIDEPETAKEHGCGTAGCVAGYVFAHVKYVQKKRMLRGASTAHRYIRYYIDPWGKIDEETGDYVVNRVLLNHLYSDGSPRSLDVARRVVDNMLRTGNVTWP